MKDRTAIDKILNAKSVAEIKKILNPQDVRGFCPDAWHNKRGHQRTRVCPACNALCAWHLDKDM